MLAAVVVPQSPHAYSGTTRNYLSHLIRGRDLTLILRRRIRDNFVLADAYLGTFWINRAVIEAGMGWHLPDFPGSEELSLVEKDSRQRRAGIWIRRTIRDNPLRLLSRPIREDREEVPEEI